MVRETDSFPETHMIAAVIQSVADCSECHAKDDGGRGCFRRFGNDVHGAVCAETKTGGQKHERNSQQLCHQKGGFLRRARAGSAK
mgnify:CR=1 FL=1